MKRLPAGLADPAHLLEPWPWQQAFMLVLLSLLAAWLLWKVLRRRGPAPPGRPHTGSARLDPLTEALEGIRSRATASGNYRRACHELAILVRSAFEGRHGSRVRVLTARELAQTFGEGARTRLIALLAGLRFGRREPTHRDFEAACDLVHEAHEPGRRGGE